MKAIVLEAADKPVILKEIEKPALKPGEVLVKLKAAALNRRDYWITVGKYAGIKYPIVLGSDGAGIVYEAGDDKDKHLLDKEVIINPGYGWGDDENFQSNNFKILGLPDDGTLAEYVKVRADQVFPKPAHLSWEQAAALPLAGLTTYRALFVKGKAKKGQKVLITGAGSGTGVFALQFAVAAGCKVFVTSGTGDKINRAKQLGAAAGVNYHGEDWAGQLEHLAGGFDVIIDSALGEGFAKLPDLCTPGGRIIIFGGTAGNIPPLNGRKLFWRQLQMLQKPLPKWNIRRNLVKLCLGPPEMLQLKVEAIKWELPDTATFTFLEITGKKVTYQAGQFITLVFDHHTDEIRRSYSLSSSPDEVLPAITVKRVANGEISRFLLTKIKPGDVLNAVEPAGRFTLNNPDEEKDVFLFAAGSGIVPVFSQLKYVLSHSGKSRFKLFYSNQNARTILFKDELEKLAAQSENRLKILHFLSSEGNRLNNQVLEKRVVQSFEFDQGKAEFYTCGPFDYMRMIRLTLLYMGIDGGKIRKENFVLETIPVSHAAKTYPPQPIRINFNHETYDIVVGENQSILQAALQNNIPLPYSCRVGDCSTCAAICKSGRIEMAKNDVLTDADLAAGWILTCTGHPVSDGVIIER